MATLRSVGCTVGAYVGDGRGEEEVCESAPVSSMDIVPGIQYVVSGDESMEQDCQELDGTRPLHFLFDCETTGLSIYADHITDIGAKVLNPPVPLTTTTFSTLVRTGRNISSAGKKKQLGNIIIFIVIYS